MEDGTFRLPGHMNGRFRWLTSPLIFDDRLRRDNVGRIRGTFRQELIRDQSLDTIRSNPLSLAAHLADVNENGVTVTFLNLDESCTLVVPVQQKNSDFSTLYDFIHNASPLVQTMFWRDVGVAIQTLALRHPGEKIWVCSTHGHGVPYLHVRVCRRPKYYPTGHFLRLYSE
jgi:hypothetical protein